LLKDVYFDVAIDPSLLVYVEIRKVNNLTAL